MTASASAIDKRSRRRTKRGHPSPPILAPYTGPSWFGRHRRLCLFVMGSFFFFYGIVWGLGGPYALPLLIPPMVPVAALVIWQLPETGKSNERLIAKGFFAYLLALSCWPDYIALDLPALPWMTMIRIIGIPLALLFVVSLSSSREFRARMIEILRAYPIVSVGVATFSAITLFSVAMSSEPFFSLNRFMLVQVNWIAMFFIACAVFSVPGNVHRFGMTLWGATVFVCFIGLVEDVTGRVPWAGRLPSFLAIADAEAIMAGAVRYTTGVRRLMSKFTTPLALGEFLSITAPFVIHVALAHRRLAFRLAALATVPVVIYIAFRTDSRLALIGLLSSSAFYVLYWAVSRLKRDRNSLVASAVTMAYPVGFVVLLAGTMLIGRIRNRVWGGGAQQSSNDARHQMYQDGIPMVLHNPFGYGIGRGGATLGYYSPSGTLTIDTYYLAAALEFGVIGFIVYYGIHVAAMIKAGRLGIARDGEFAWLGPVAIALFNFVLGKSVLAQMENHPLSFMLMGAVVAMSYRALKESPPPQIPSHPQIRP